MRRNICKYIVAVAALTGLALPVAADTTGDLVSPVNLAVREPSFYSPQVTELMRYDAHATVSHNTGCINPTIQLVHFQDKDFDFPVSISYNSSGFRPRDVDNYVGRDWMLNAGGVVYREVNGIPDDFKSYRANSNDLYAYTGFLQMLGRNTYNLSTMKQEVAQAPYKYAHLKDIQSTMVTIPSTDNGNPVECSPDIYHFSFGRHSGKFMINYDGSVSVVGYDGGKYEVDLSGMKLFSNTMPQDTYIRIKTDDGYIYTFGGGGYAALEYSALSWNQNYNFTPESRTHHEITAFHLTQIKAPNGRALTIRYRDIESKYHTYPRENLIELNQPGKTEWADDLQIQYQLAGRRSISTPYSANGMDLGTGTNPALYTQSNATPVYSLQKIALIDRIETDGCIISFTYSARAGQPFPVTNPDNHFFTSCGARLDRVSMTYNGCTQNAQLTYKHALGNRMFLNSVKTSNEGTFGMEYNLPVLSETPDPLTCNIDHWGFWRGENSNVALIPGMSYPSTQFSLDYKLTTNHRDATGNRYDTSLLSRLTYPTGGSARFTYEPHKYSCIIRPNGDTTSYPSENNLSPSLSGLAGGARIRSVRYTDAEGNALKETVYTYGSLSREGKVMYMPYYRHLLVEKAESDRIWIRGAAFNSDGFNGQAMKGAHIRYPEVTEHYIDPSKGGLEQKHPYKKLEFRTDLSLALSYYNTNDYFQTLKTSGDSHVYTLYPDNYLTHLKHLVAYPTDDISQYYSQLVRETYYDEDNVVRRKVDYTYDILNQGNYSLCLRLPNIGGRLHFNLFTHIGREYFRVIVPTATQTTDYYGPQGAQTHVRWERMKYDNAGYLTELVTPKNLSDSLVTTWQRSEYAAGTGFQVVPVTVRKYIGKAGGSRQLLETQQIAYTPLCNAEGASWYVPSREQLSDKGGGTVSVTEYPRYDAYGNPLEMVVNGSERTVFLWSHSGQSLRARIENASYQEVSTALGKDPGSLSATGNDEAALDNLRALLPAARVYSYWSTYGNKPTVIRESNGRDTRYAYESGERLSRVFRYGENGTLQMLQMNQYHFVNP